MGLLGKHSDYMWAVDIQDIEYCKVLDTIYNT